MYLIQININPNTSGFRVVPLWNLIHEFPARSKRATTQIGASPRKKKAWSNNLWPRPLSEDVMAHIPSPYLGQKK